MSRALTSDRVFQDHKQPLYEAYYKLLEFALTQAGYPVDKYAILKPYCIPGADVVYEKRKHEWVKFYIDAIQSNVDLASVPDINDCDFMGSVPFRLKGTFATFTTAMAGVNNDILFKSDATGTVGNSTSIQYVATGNNSPLSVSITGKDIVVHLATDGAGLPISTGTEIANAVNAYGPARDLLTAYPAPGNSGVGVVTTLLPKTFLSGGA